MNFTELSWIWIFVAILGSHIMGMLAFYILENHLFLLLEDCPHVPQGKKSRILFLELLALGGWTVVTLIYILDNVLLLAGAFWMTIFPPINNLFPKIYNLIIYTNEYEGEEFCIAIDRGDIIKYTRKIRKKRF